MTLRTKLAWIVAAVVLGYAVCDHVIQRWIVLPRFEALERRGAQTDALRVRRALLAEVDALDSRCSEWASWLETCAWLEASRDGSEGSRHARESFEASNLGLESFRQSRINLLYLVDGDGTVRFGRVRDLESGAELALRELAYEKLAPNHPLLVRAGGDGSLAAEPIRGLSLTELGPMFLSSRPLACSGRERGTLILGRLLSTSLVASLRARTELRFDVEPVDRSLAAADAAILDEVTASVDPIVRESGGEQLLAYTSLDDLHGLPALLLRLELDRPVSRSGSDAVRYSLVSTVAAGLLLLFVLLAVLRRTVVDPISRLTAQAVEIGRTDDYSRAVALDRADELGVLSRELQSMMGKLEASRAQRVDAAHSAGMSEIATGILHNVGNVLNSVNVSTDLIVQRLKASRLGKLERLADLARKEGERFGEFVATSPKGKHVGPFLVEVSEGLRAEHDELEREARSLETGVEHIRKLVDAQQELAGRKEQREPVDLAAQIDLAWSIASRACGHGAVPELVHDVADLGRVLLDRHKLVQVLVNLFKNACESIAERGGPGTIRVRVHAPSTGRVAIEVSDDGTGIAPEHVARMFSYGFTTKPGGHGLGLHSCANAAKEMDGAMRVHSDGPGRGATFVLELPTAARAAA
jgi:signal transduction histidine kinase